MANTSWQDVAKTAQDLRDASIGRINPPVPDVPSDLPRDVTNVPKHLLAPDEVLITETSPEDLTTALASGKFTSTAVTNAFLRRAGLAQKLVRELQKQNATVERLTLWHRSLLPEEALTRAKYLDNYYNEHKRPVGPLHGIPISVKEHIGMKDKGLNGGFVSWWDRKGEDDAHVLKILWRAGCVFYTRTTQP